MKLLGGAAAAEKARAEAERAAEEAAQQQAWDEYHQAVADAIAECWALLATAALTPGFGSRTIAVIGGKGGSNKTTVTAMLLHVFSQLVRMLTAGVDLNPAVSTFVRRFVTTPDPTVGRLTQLAKDLAQVRWPADLDRYLQPAPGRVHLVHNTNVADPKAVAQIASRAEIDAVLARLSHLAQLLILDTGNWVAVGGHNPADQLFTAALDAADHVVIAALGSVDALQSLQQSFQQLDSGRYRELLKTATVVIGIDKNDIDPSELAAEVSKWNNNCGAAFVVPYDLVFDGGGLIRWEEMAPATLLPILQACVHAAQVFTQPARATDTGVGTVA